MDGVYHNSNGVHRSWQSLSLIPGTLDKGCYDRKSHTEAPDTACITQGPPKKQNQLDVQIDR